MMNNLIKVAMMALAFASFSMAEGLSVGGHVSGAYSAFWGDSDMEDFWGPGFNAGIALYLPFTPSIGFNPEVTFGYRSESNEETEEGLKMTGDLSQMNIDIPLLFRFNVVSGLFFEAGPFMSLALSDNFDYTAEYNGEDVTAAVEAEAEAAGEPIEGPDQKFFEMGILAGVGYSITQKIDIDARFGLGLTKLYDDADAKSFMFHLGGTFWFM